MQVDPSFVDGPSMPYNPGGEQRWQTWDGSPADGSMMLGHGPSFQTWDGSPANGSMMLGHDPSLQTWGGSPADGSRMLGYDQSFHTWDGQRHDDSGHATFVLIGQSLGNQTSCVQGSSQTIDFWPESAQKCNEGQKQKRQYGATKRKYMRRQTLNISAGNMMWGGLRPPLTTCGDSSCATLVFPAFASTCISCFCPYCFFFYFAPCPYCIFYPAFNQLPCIIPQLITISQTCL